MKKPVKSRRKWRIGRATVAETAEGTFAVYLPLSAGKSARRRCKTLAEAEAWILGGAPVPLTSSEISDAVEARRILPAGVTLCAAARCYVGRNSCVSASPLSAADASYPSAATSLGNSDIA